MLSSELLLFPEGIMDWNLVIMVWIHPYFTSFLCREITKLAEENLPGAAECETSQVLHLTS